MAAAFLGTRETLQPKAAARQRGGAGSRRTRREAQLAVCEDADDAELNTASSPVREPAEKKMKKDLNTAEMSTHHHDKSATAAVDSDDGSVANDERTVKEEWKSTDILQLIDQIQSVMPNDDNIKYSTMADKLEWDKVKVATYKPVECKDQWIHITTKLRRFRTMSELLVDAKQWAKHPWNAFGKKTTKHPEMPKKPLTPYFRFFMRKRVSYAKKHPDMSVTDLTKELSKKYGTLSEHKKQKYIDSYNKDMELWKASMVKFRLDHPEVFDDDAGGNGSSGVLSKQFGLTVPPKTITAMQIYINEKCEADQRKGSKVTRKELYEKYKRIWQSLNDLKKLKYIKLAIEAKKKYDEDMKKYCTEHPEFHPRVVKTFLSKAEQKIKDRIDGKPEKPPSNGYSLFTVETLSSLSHLPNNERLGEVSRRWKKLSEDKKEAYNLKAEERNQEYKRAYSKYLLSLPEDVRKRLEKDDVDKQTTKKKLSPALNLPSASQVTSPSIDRPMKPVADVFMFIEDKKADYKKKYPQMDENELHRFMVKEFNCISERDKAKYKKMAEQERERLAKESAQSVSSSLKKGKRIPFPGEPAKPSHSGYQLFSREMLVQLREVKANERLQEIGRRWAALREDERQHWNKRKDAMWVQYRKELAKFKKSLSAKELKRFEEMNATSRSKKKKTKEEEPEASAAEDTSTDSSSSDDDDDDENEKPDVVNSDANTTDDDDDSSDADADDDDDDDKGDAVVAADNGIDKVSSDSDNSSSDDDDDEADDNEDGEVGSESEADEETAEQLAKKLLQDSATGNTQGKSGRLDASEVYNDSSDSSTDDSSDSSN